MKIQEDILFKSLKTLKSANKSIVPKRVPIIEDLEEDPIEKYKGLWLDPRADADTKKVILEVAPEMVVRCKKCNPYDSCVEWMTALSGHGVSVDMYRGNGGHYWLSVNGVVFDPKATKVVGYPNISSDSYDAEKVIWKDDEYVNNDILNENPTY